MMQNSAKWYVYELVDGRDSAVFYVGKGSGRRMFAHEAEAMRQDKPARSRKADRIREIVASGADVQRRQVAFFWDEQAAYDHETDLIEFHGLNSLTNVLPGGQIAWERRKAERKSRIYAAKEVSPTDMVVGMAGQVAYWLIQTNGGKKRVLPVFNTGNRVMDAARNKISAVAWGELLPALWNKAIASSDGLQRVSAALKPYGIELVDVAGA